MNQLLPNNVFLSYVRVSSKDQSRGTSLEEQKFYIERYAKSKGFIVKKFYGEVESASKAGREIFDEMIKQLQKEKLQGIIFHKVDRSARNPRDQALLYELMQSGYELHFVSENLNTAEPMGRNMMYMLWGMASAYSENLKFEINKGISGRLKQGRWPLPAPLGFRKIEDCKSVIDPTKGPFVRKIFEEYGTGKYSIEDLVLVSRKIGLVNKHGRYLIRNTLHRILRDTFYYGLMTHKRGTFPGEYEPLISKALFDKVQFILRDRGFKSVRKFEYLFRGLLKCQVCGRRLKSMTSRGHGVSNRYWTYYHCRDWECGVKTIRESVLEEQFLEYLKELEFVDEEVDSFKKAIISFRKTLVKSNEEQVKALDLELGNIESRLDALLQKYIGQKIDEDTYSKTRKALQDRQLEIRERKGVLEKTSDKALEQMGKLGKLLKNPLNAYKTADFVNKRRMMISMVENFTLSGKKLMLVWKKPFDIVAKRPKFQNGGGGGNCIRVQISTAKFSTSLVSFIYNLMLKTDQMHQIVYRLSSS